MLFDGEGAYSSSDEEDEPQLGKRALFALGLDGNLASSMMNFAKVAPERLVRRFRQRAFHRPPVTIRFEQRTHAIQVFEFRQTDGQRNCCCCCKKTLSGFLF